jgi:ubiquinone/menaquinone biosynthesis C-methylase UbiE
MVDIAARRVEPFGDRATVERTEGEPRLPQPDGWGDRVVSTYVLDLLSDEDIRIVLGEAHRVLRPGGMLCVVGITPGEAGLSRLLMNVWQRIHALKPILVGGCRPLRVADYLDQQQWQPLHHSVVTAWGVSSEVTVARRNDA